MKTMKVALLATAALAAVSASARADDAADIKAQLEALTARIAQLEAAPAVPTGFSLLTISEGPATVVPGLGVRSQDAAGYGDKATIIGIMPTADVPASTTVEWSGYVRAAILYKDYNDNIDTGSPAIFDEDDDDLSVRARGQLKVVGKTDTAVGEVGVQMQLRAEAWEVDTNSPVTMNEAWGWWAMTPEVTLGGGFTGSLGNVGYGYDGACSCYYIDNADVYTNPGDALQLRLSWASGPIGFAVAVEDATGGNAFSTNGDNDSAGFFTDDGLGVAAEVKYSGDTVSGEISAIWRESGAYATAPFIDVIAGVIVPADDAYMVGAGLGFALGDMASISLAANIGHFNYDADFWNVNALVSANLTDSVHAEVGAGWKTTDFDGLLSGIESDTWAVMAGLYYEPVAQLTIGVEAEYTETEFDLVGFTYEEDRLFVDLVTVYRF
jgi:opacity protein-like surface antigen